MSQREIFCATCGAQTLFEAPPCGDAHDDGCPELLCTSCGGAILVAPLAIRVWLRPRAGQIAPHQRRAA